MPPIRVGRMIRVLVVFAGALLVPGLLASSAQAQDDGAGIFGSLKYEDPETEEDVPVEGVVLEATGEGGFAESGTSDAEGAFRIAVPGDGEYTVTLDTATLPEGINLRNPESNPRGSFGECEIRAKTL